MPRLNLRQKLLCFALLLAVVPLLVAGRTLIRIAQDELKSAANDRLIATARQITEGINARYEQTWLAPLLLIRNALDDERLDVDSKIALLRQGLVAIPDIVMLQITVADAGLPLVVLKDEFGAKLQAAGLDPLTVLRLPASEAASPIGEGEVAAGPIHQLAPLDEWLATIVLPLRAGIGGAAATLSARIDLAALREVIAADPFNQIGHVTLIGPAGRQLFDPSPEDLTQLSIVAKALDLLRSGSRVIGVEPYQRPGGERMLASFAFPRPFDWVVLVELSEQDAYLAVDLMVRSLALWVGLGMLVAIAGAIGFALMLSRPILAIGRAAIEVSKGNLATRVRNVHAKDEIGDLAQRMNDMIVQLNERFQLAKFVSSGTMAAIRSSDHEGVRLGGERRRVAMLFCDIRGYTAFAERTDPEQVVEVLNFYLQHQADLVAAHDGDIDKFVGDQIVAVFQGDDLVRRAIACALEIQSVMDRLGRERPEVELSVGIGIHVGEVVMGAMGSRQRMDFTVLGDNVNLAARLCAHAGPRQILISEDARQAVADCPEFRLVALPAITVKGKIQPVAVFQVDRAPPEAAAMAPQAALGGQSR